MSCCSLYNFYKSLIPLIPKKFGITHSDSMNDRPHSVGLISKCLISRRLINVSHHGYISKSRDDCSGDVQCLENKELLVKL